MWVPNVRYIIAHKAEQHLGQVSYRTGILNNWIQVALSEMRLVLIRLKTKYKWSVKNCINLQDTSCTASYWKSYCPQVIVLPYRLSGTCSRYTLAHHHMTSKMHVWQRDVLGYCHLRLNCAVDTLPLVLNPTSKAACVCSQQGPITCHKVMVSSTFHQIQNNFSNSNVFYAVLLERQKYWK